MMEFAQIPTRSRPPIQNSISLRPRFNVIYLVLFHDTCFFPIKCFPAIDQYIAVSSAEVSMSIR